jgi:thimet oligopeptidase
MKPAWSSRMRIALAPLVLFVAPFAGAQPYVFPTYSNPAEIESTCQSLLSRQRSGQQQLAQWPDAKRAEMLAEFDAMQRRYEDTLGPLYLLASVHPDKAIRDAAEACDRLYQDFNTTFLQDVAAYERLKKLEAADSIDRRLQRDLLDAYEDAGVNLPAEAQERAKVINNDLTRLMQEFNRRVREDKTLVAFTAAELAGVPTDVWRKAKRDGAGRYLLGLDNPTSFPVIDQAHQAAARERMWRAVYAQGGPENLTTLAQIGQLRREYAALFGHASYADFVLRRRMARSGVEVARFLADVKAAVAEREVADLALLRAAKGRHLRLKPAATTLERWDVAYYTERVRKARHQVREEQFRQYFPPEQSLQFVFRLAERLFGVRLTAASQPLWHPDARTYVVSEVAGKQTLGTLFVDLYPRADKYNHAAVWSFRNVSTLASRAPAAALVVNFNRKGLSLEELETLLHEFGHALHNLLSTTRYVSQGGTNVMLDFVEAPSQMLEEWVFDARVLRLFGKGCKTCKAVPPDLLARAGRARHFAKGIKFARQHLYASYDLALHGTEPVDPMPLWARMEGVTPLGHVAGSSLPASFTHVAGGYAAGYYSYLWSLVLAEDLRTAFAADKLDGAVGRRYRDTVLANGGQVSPDELLQRFLGRPSNSQAFFRALDIR